MLGFSPDEWTAIFLSLRVATVATIFAVPFAILAAYALARWKFPGKIVLDSILHLPLVMPPVVTGYLLLLTFGKQGAIGKLLNDLFGFSFSFRWTGAALACGVMGFPLMLRAIRLSFDSIDRRLETAAGTLGANPAWTFLLVTLPLALPGIIVGAILASLRRWANSERRLLSCRTFRARRKRYLRPFTPIRRFRVERRRL